MADEGVKSAAEKERLAKYVAGRHSAILLKLRDHAWGEDNRRYKAAREENERHLKAVLESDLIERRGDLFRILAMDGTVLQEFDFSDVIKKEGLTT